MALYPNITVQVDADTAKALAQLAGFTAAADALLSSIDGDKSFDDFYNGKRSEKEAAKGGRDANQSWNDGWNKQEKKNEPKRRSQFARALKKWSAIVLAFGETVGVALYGAAGAIVSLGSSLLSAVSAAALLVPLGVGLAGAFAAIAIGVQGVGSALGAVSASFGTIARDGQATEEQLRAIEEALNDLNPAARDFVEAFQALGPVFSEIQTAVSEGLFSGLDAYLLALKPTIEGVGEAFVGLADVANGALKDVINVLIQADLPGIFERLTPAIGSVLGALAPLTEAFFSFVDTATPAATLLADQFKAWADNLADFVTSAEGIESIEGFLDRALESLQSWLDLIAEVGKVISNVMRIASEEGDGLVDSLAQVLRDFNVFLESPEGEDAVINFLQTSSELLKSLLPILQGAKKFFDVLVTDGAVARFAELAENVGELLPLLAEVLNVISRTNILNSFVKALIAIGDALPFEELGELASVIGEFLGDAIVALTPTLNILGEAIGVVAEYLIEFFAVLDESGALESLGVALESVATVVLALVEALGPLLPVIAELGGVLIVAMAESVERMVPSLLSIIESLVPFVELIAELTVLMLPLIELALVPFLVQLELFIVVLDAVLAVAGPMIEFIATMGAGFEDLITFLTPVSEWLTDITDQWNEMFTNISEATTEFVQTIKSAISDFLDDINAAFAEFASTVAAGWNKFWDTIYQAATGFFSAIASLATRGWNSLLASFRRFGSDMQSNWRSITSSIERAWDASIGRVIAVASDFINSLIDGFASIPDRISSALSSIPEAIAAPFRRAYAPVAAAIDRIRSIADGIGNIIGKLNPFAKGGIVSGPTPALIGEAGAEAVIPLTRPLSQVDPSVRGMAAMIRGENQGGYAASVTNMGGAANNTTSNTTNNFTINDATGDAEATAQKVINRMALSL